jgi:hypothetical protein
MLPTNIYMINDCQSSVKCRRREETSNVLGYIHGGKEPAVVGAWDFLTAHGSKENLDILIGKYRRGKYLQSIVNKVMNDYSNSKDSLPQAMAFKYQNFLSRRKFNLMCKTQSSVFDPDAEVWLPRNVKCLGVHVEISLSRISDQKLAKFTRGN